uniref:Uncharacterized protein n=1 Tax=Arundo donax TaxID=35708 RepID=A0A0A9DJK2_ARUDO
MRGLQRIASAFNDAYRKFESLEHLDWNELLTLLCTPSVGSKLGGRGIANSYTNTPQRSHQQTRSVRRGERDQRLQEARGLTGSRPINNNPQTNTTVHQTAVQHLNRSRPQVYAAVRQTAGSSQNLYHPQDCATVNQTAPYQNYYYPQVYPASLQTAGPYQNPNQQVYTTEFVTAGPYQSHNHVTGFQTAGTYQNQNQQVYPAGFQAAGPIQNQQRRKYTSNHQTNRHAATARYEPVRGRSYNGATLDSRSQASNGAASQR